MADLDDLARGLSRLIPDALPDMQHAAGREGKKLAADEIRSDLGDDGMFSGWRSKVRLASGYDLEGDDQVRLNLRPGGLWTLANDGRKRTKRVTNKKRSGKKALSTPYGAFSAVVTRPTNGFGTVDRITKELPAKAAKAAREALFKRAKAGIV